MVRMTSSHSSGETVKLSSASSAAAKQAAVGWGVELLRRLMCLFRVVWHTQFVGGLITLSITAYGLSHSASKLGPSEGGRSEQHKVSWLKRSVSCLLVMP